MNLKTKEKPYQLQELCGQPVSQTTIDAQSWKFRQEQHPSGTGAALAPTRLSARNDEKSHTNLMMFFFLDNFVFEV